MKNKKFKVPFNLAPCQLLSASLQYLGEFHFKKGDEITIEDHQIKVDCGTVHTYLKVKIERKDRSSMPVYLGWVNAHGLILREIL